MQQDIRYVGLDVHATTIAVAVADAGREGAQALGTIPHQAEAVARLMRKLGPARTLRHRYPDAAGGGPYLRAPDPAGTPRRA